MQSFTEEIKNEIASYLSEERCCRLALISAFIRTSGSVVSRGGDFGFEIINQNENTAEYI